MATNELYPPRIDNILPAFIKKSGELNILIPFQLNPAVGYGDYNKIAYVIYSATSNTEITSGTFEEKGSYNSETKQYEFTLTLSNSTIVNKFKVGQHYKFQIAFQKDSNIGYYSSAGIAKYISKPTISVSQSGLREITGTFSDSTTYEKVYTYKFNLYNEFDGLLETSGELLHNVSNDRSASSSVDHWEIQTVLQPEIKYQIEYQVTTENNYTAKSSKVKISQTETIAPRVDSNLIVENNFEEGYNKIYLDRNIPPTKNDDREISGNFYLLRASDKDDYSHWESLIDFQMYKWTYAKGEHFDIYKDYFVEQGVSYRYAIQAYSAKGIYSTKLLNKNGPVYTDFEDMFLYDGEKQLKIRFNPKIGTFKNNVLESKVDTIGGIYPYFFRNGNTNYKEFSISGLISMLSDYDSEFFQEKTLINENSRMICFDTELSSQNYKKERDFKLKVLSWLTNGENKILKTPAEGNYIVRLINTSLSPNDTLGRMLHTFTSTAYEVASYDFSNLKYLNFINKSNALKRKTTTKKLDSSGATVSLSSNVKIDQAILYGLPNQEITYTRRGKSGELKITTNAYGIADFTSNLSRYGLKSITTSNTNDIWGEGSTLVYSYLNKIEDVDDWYYIKTVSEPTEVEETYSGKGLTTFFKSVVNENDKITSSFPYLRIFQKPTTTIYKDKSVYYTDKEYTKKMKESDFEAGKLYYVKETKKYIIGTASNKEVAKSTGLFFIEFEDERIDLEDNVKNSKSVIFRDVDDFALGKGLKVEMRYPRKTLDIEEENINYAI